MTHCYVNLVDTDQCPPLAGYGSSGGDKNQEAPGGPEVFQSRCLKNLPILVTQLLLFRYMALEGLTIEFSEMGK